MNRFFLIACLGGLAPASVMAQVPQLGSAPSADFGPGIAVHEAPCTESCSPKLLTRLTAMFSKKTCAPDACTPDAACVGPGGCSSGGRCSTIECWDRFKYWLCFRSNNGKLLPCCEPTPYRPPLYNWFPCQPGCGAGCGSCGGAAGCGGPPITYYYPSKEHPAPPQPKVELRAPHSRYPGTAMQPAAKPAVLPGLRFASAETPVATKRTPGVTPAAAAEPAAPLAARPEAAPFGYYQSSFKKSEFQP